MTTTAQTRPRVLDVGIANPASAIYIGNSFFYYNNSLHGHVGQLIAEGMPGFRHRATSVTISGSGFDWHDVDSYFRPKAIGGYTPLEKVYGYEPMSAVLDAAHQKHVLGAQGQLWTEYMATPEKVEYMGWPRLSALSEVLWSPKEQRDYGAFARRLQSHLERLKALSVNYRPLDGAKSFPH